MISHTGLTLEGTKAPPQTWDGSPEQSCGSARAMGGQSKTFRLAIGLFSEVRALGEVLADLSGQEFTTQSVCLIGLSETVCSGFWSREFSESASVFRPLFDGVEALQGLIGDISCVASSGPLLDDLCATSVARSDRFHGGPDWFSASQVKRIQDHLRSGGLVLIANSATPAQQDASCRTLLRHSQHGVQTYDFTLRTGEATRSSV